MLVNLRARAKRGQPRDMREVAACPVDRFAGATPSLRARHVEQTHGRRSTTSRRLSAPPGVPGLSTCAVPFRHMTPAPRCLSQPIRRGRIPTTLAQRRQTREGLPKRQNTTNARLPRQGKNVGQEENLMARHSPLRGVSMNSPHMEAWAKYADPIAANLAADGVTLGMPIASSVPSAQ